MDLTCNYSRLKLPNYVEMVKDKIILPPLEFTRTIRPIRSVDANST